MNLICSVYIVVVCSIVILYEIAVILLWKQVEQSFYFLIGKNVNGEKNGDLFWFFLDYWKDYSLHICTLLTDHYHLIITFPLKSRQDKNQ